MLCLTGVDSREDYYDELGIYLCPDCHNAFEEELMWIEDHTEMDILSDNELEDCEDNE
jgi:hypothetical protein